jgi:NAD(P)-dependent dehydrogenase (short-subunit alcohol dehydrogenase family)
VIDYCAAKAALGNFCKAPSKEYGPVETDLWLGDHGVAATVSGGVDPHAVVDKVAATTLTGRFTRPDEVADLVVLLAGGRAGNVTGADVTIDGGLIQTL